MKELKFRAFDKLTKKMSIEFMLFGEFTLIGGVHAWQNEEAESIGIVYGSAEYHDSLQRLDDLEIMQTTGLKDKNGWEIYEGDIVRILYTDWPSQSPNEKGAYELSNEEYVKSISRIGTVIWDDGEACMAVRLYSKRHADYYNGSIHPGAHGQIEIIGDIFRTPELLEK